METRNGPSARPPARRETRIPAQRRFALPKRSIGVHALEYFNQAGSVLGRQQQMYSTVTAETQADEIGARVVALIFVYVMKVNRDVLMAFSACCAFTSIIFPRIYSSLTISLVNGLAFMVSIGNSFVRCASCLLPLIISLIRLCGHDAMRFAKVARKWTAWLAALSAKPLAKTRFSSFLYSILFPNQAISAQRLACGRQFLAAHADLSVKPFNPSDAVLVKAHAASNFSRISGLLQQFKRFCLVDSSGHVMVSNDRSVVTIRVLSSTPCGRRHGTCESRQAIEIGG